MFIADKRLQRAIDHEEETRPRVRADIFGEPSFERILSRFFVTKKIESREISMKLERSKRGGGGEGGDRCWIFLELSGTTKRL